jgi:MFS transporter, DHA3 family, macrolide efflux protein
VLETINGLYRTPAGAAFLRLWFGQFVSVLGSAATTFAIGVYLYQRTGQAAPIYFTALAHFLPRLLLSVPVGTLIDRYNRVRLFIFSDLFQAIITGILLVLVLVDSLNPLILYIMIAIKSAAGVLQENAEPAIVADLLPEDQLGKAYGLASLQEGSSSLLAPLLGAALVSSIGLKGVFLIDLLSFVIAAFCTASIHTHLKQQNIASKDQFSFIESAQRGIAFLKLNPGLLWLAMAFASFNLTLSMSSRLVTPLVLERTGQNSAALAIVATAFGIGTLLGGFWVTVYGTPARKVSTMLIAMAVAGLSEQFLMGLGQVVLIWALANLIGGFVLPFYESANYEITAQATPTELRGRVFAMKSLLTRSVAPVTLLSGGLLADQFFEPAMRGPLGVALEPVLGVGPGRGFALMMLIFGVLTVLGSLLWFLNRPMMGLDRAKGPVYPVYELEF